MVVSFKNLRKISKKKVDPEINYNKKAGTFHGMSLQRINYQMFIV
jgi:hypothetical protein